MGDHTLQLFQKKWSKWWSMPSLWWLHVPTLRRYLVKLHSSHHALLILIDSSYQCANNVKCKKLPQRMQWTPSETWVLHYILVPSWNKDRDWIPSLPADSNFVLQNINHRYEYHRIMNIKKYFKTSTYHWIMTIKKYFIIIVRVSMTMTMQGVVQSDLVVPHFIVSTTDYGMSLC